MDEHDILELKTKVDEQTAANKAEHESFKRRLKDLEDGGKERTEMLLAIQRQGDAIQSMDKKMDGISASVGRVEKRVDEIEKEPADRYKKLAFEVIKYIVLAVVGVAVGYFIKG